MNKLCFILMLALAAGTVSAAETEEIELTAVKDTFGRSNNRNGNSGAAPLLLVAPSPGVNAILAFDLSSVTNEIESAEFLFRIQADSDTPLSLTVAPMVHNAKNGTWIEGSGNLGIRGQNAVIGDATFQWRAFRDRPWVTKNGRSAQNLMDSDLWEAPIAKLNAVEWIAGEWVSVPIRDAAFLEAIRNDDLKTSTIGIWGTSGKGIYKIDSKESGSPAKLKLTVKRRKARVEKTP